MISIATTGGTPLPTPDIAIVEPVQPETVHSPTSAIRFGLATVFVALCLIPLVGSGGDSSTFRSQFQLVLDGLPKWILDLSAGSLRLVTIAVTVAGLVSLIVTRHFRRLLRLFVAAVIAVITTFAVAALVGHDVLRVGRPARAVFGTGAAFPTTEGLAVLTAGLVVQSHWWSARWRRLSRIVLVFAVAARVLTAIPEPSTMLMAVAIGVAAARLTDFLVGIPNQRPKARDVANVLTRFGYNLESVEVTREATFRGIATFRAKCRDKGLLFVKVTNPESWVAGLPTRLYRYVRFREIGDERPFVAVRHRVEHEGLCALKAFADGVPTPRLTVVSEFPGDAMMLAFEAKHMRPLDALEPHERNLELLDKAWQVVVSLRESKTVHHHLNGEFLWVDDDYNVMVVDFSAAELGATERTLAADTAEVLAITAARLGVERAVQAGLRAIGPEGLAHALPRLQPLALSRATRAAVKEANCLEPLRAEVQRVTGVDEAPTEDLERIKPRTVVSILMLALGLSAIVPQLLGAGDVWGKTRTANLWWVATALGLSVITYIGAAYALEGSVPDRLPFGPNLGVQFATSFVGVAAPGGALALSARFLQRRGIDPALAMAAVGVDTIAGVLVHFSLLGVFIAQAGSSGLASFDIPVTGTVTVAAAIVAVVAVVLACVPRTRSILTGRVVPALKRAGHGLAETARHPMNLVKLFGGSATITMGYLLALEVSVLAFGDAPAFTSVALVYLVGSVISSVAPTPGGIGAVEATLVAGLTSAGMRSDSALGAVMLFRIATFWLPLLPGWLAFTVLQRSGDL
jgi:glycosyltransferase 2 family protein